MGRSSFGAVPYSRRSRCTRRSSSSRLAAPTASETDARSMPVRSGPVRRDLELARQLRALVGLGAGPVVAVALLVEDVVGVDEPAADHRDRLLV